MRSLFCFSLLAVLLSSCSMIGRMGIEKRKYRPGFYVSAGGREGNVQKKWIDRAAGVNKEAGKKETIFLNPDHSVSLTAASTEIVNDIVEHEQMQPLSPVLRRTPAYKSSVHVFPHGDHEANSWAGVLLALGGILIAFGLILLFPGLNPELAFAIGGIVAVVLLVLIAVFVGKKKSKS